MTELEKLECIAECVEMDAEDLNPDMVLDDLENWDSVAVLSIIAIINEKYNRFPSAEKILAYSTVRDLMNEFE